MEEVSNTKRLGWVQRSILDNLTDTYLPADAARDAYGTDAPTAAQLVAVRRAMRNLEQQGLIGIGGLSASPFGRAQWLYARPPFTDDDRARGERVSALLSGLVSSGPRGNVHVCTVCGADYRAAITSHVRLYCSSACKQSAYRARRYG